MSVAACIMRKERLCLRSVSSTSAGFRFKGLGIWGAWVHDPLRGRPGDMVRRQAGSPADVGGHCTH